MDIDKAFSESPYHVQQGHVNYRSVHTPTHYVWSKYASQGLWKFHQIKERTTRVAVLNLLSR